MRSTPPPTTSSQGPRRRLGARLILLVLGFLVAGAGAALALFVVSVIDDPGNDALAHATSLSVPTTPTVHVDGSGAITVGWSLPLSQLSGAQYKVTRTGPGSPVTVCTVPSATTSCQDTGLTANTEYGYSIMAVIGTNWQSSAVTTSATTATPTLSVAFSAGPYAVGQAITVQTITAKIGTNVDTTYTGGKTLSWTGLANSPSGQVASYPLSSVTFSNGVASPGSTFTAYGAGSNTLTATDSGAGAVTGSVTLSLSSATLDHLAFAAASPQTDGAAFAGTNTLTAEDLYNNAIAGFNAATDNVTVTANSPLTGTVSFTSGATGNVLNTASDFSEGVANLSGLGMTYTGNAGSGTFTATSANAPTKTGTSGSVTIAVGTLAHFAFAAASPQTDGAAFAGTNTLTAQDVGNNAIAGFNAATDNVTVTANSPLTGTVSFTSGATGNVLNTASDFSEGVANLSGLGMTYTGNAASGTFTATSANAPTKTGTSGSVTIAVGTLAHFAFAAASPQTDGAAFAGTNTLTAQDVGNNAIAGFNAATDNVTVTANSPLTGTVSFTSGATGNVLNTASDFSEGVANLSGLGMTYTGNAASGTFTATSANAPTKTGTSGGVTIVAASATYDLYAEFHAYANGHLGTTSTTTNASGAFSYYRVNTVNQDSGNGNDVQDTANLLTFSNYSALNGYSQPAVNVGSNPHDFASFSGVTGANPSAATPYVAVDTAAGSIQTYTTGASGQHANVPSTAAVFTVQRDATVTQEIGTQFDLLTSSPSHDVDWYVVYIPASGTGGAILASGNLGLTNPANVTFSQAASAGDHIVFVVSPTKNTSQIKVSLTAGVQD